MWSRAPDAVAVVVATHPHPLMGGDMENLVPAGLAAGLPGRGVSVLRFDFRGVRQSEGTHGGGTAEVLDVRAALAEAESSSEHGDDLPFGSVPLVLVGYSFGADVAARSQTDALDAWVLVAPPLADPKPLCAGDPRPVLVLAAAHDQYFPYDDAVSRTANWVTATTEEIPGADHFLAGRSAWLVDRIATFVDQLRGEKVRSDGP